MSFEKKRKIIDCFLFYNETDILEYRLTVLWDIVDFFVISEASLSFIGNSKPFFSDDARFDKFRNKIDEDDVLILNDVVEIPDPFSLKSISTLTNVSISVSSFFIFRQKYHCYNLKTVRDIDWIHAKAFSVRTWKEKLMSECFSTIRLYGVTLPIGVKISPQLILNGGWHLSYFGTIEFISNKLQNFSHQEFDVSLDDIITRKEEGKDIMGREDITHTIVPLEKNTYLPPKAFFFFQQM